MFWNLETYLSDLTGQENSLAYQVCTRAHAKCLKVITDQQAFNSERSNNRNAVISLPHKINPHVPPTILGISGILTCFSSPKISHYMLNMALEQASAPFIPNTPLRRSSFSGSPSFTTTSNNTFPLTPSPQIVQNNISSISPRVQSMRPRRSFSWFSNHRPKLDLRGHVATTPSLEELHQGDAFSFTRYLVKTRTTASSNTDPDSLSRQRSKPVTEYPSNNSSSSNFSKDVLGETWGAVLPSPAITSTGVNDKSKLQNPHYFYSQQTFIAALNQITSRLMLLPKESRQSSLRAELALLNHNLPARVCIPLWCPATKMKPMHHIVCRIVVSECVVLNSAEKVPYLLLVEVLDNVEELKEEDSGFPKNPIDMSDIDVSSLKNIYNTSANNTEVTFADDKSVSASPKMIERKFPEFKLKLLSPVPYPGRAGDLNAYHNMTLNKLISPPPFESDGTTDDFFPRMRTAAVMLAQLNSSDSHVKPAAKQQIKDRILKEMAQLEEHRMNSVIEQRHRFNKRSSSHLNHSTSLPHMKKASEHTNNDTDEEPSINEQLLRSVKEDPSASVFREPWSAKEDRIKRTSPYGHFSSWRLLSVIVKTGSDLRQEQLACQLIREMKTIWKHEEVDIWVY